MSSSTKAKADPSGQSSATTLDDFLGGRIAVVQPKTGHRAGSDAVWLQAAVPASAKDRVLDAGAGVGVAGLCLAARFPQITVTAVEIDEDLCALAVTNAVRNGLAKRFTAINADVTARSSTLAAKGLARESYHQVMANPPYYCEGTVRTGSARATAHVMAGGTLGAWVKFLATMTAPKGAVTLIHVPQALPELLPLLAPRFGGLAVFPLFAKAGEPATRVILQGRKGSKAPLRQLPGLALHDEDGSYTAQAEAVLRHGGALELGA
jgi:tRNA1(Val) A37 N6-methylase TrmN6